MSIVPTATQQVTPDSFSSQNVIHIFDFPVEVLERIIQEVEVLVNDREKIRKKKGTYTQVMYRGSTRCAIYTSDHQPILNTFQNLSVVNREFYSLCCPRLWKTLCFPSALPTLISQWDDILSKYGELVRCIEITLSGSWLERLPDQFSGPDCDNLIILGENVILDRIHIGGASSRGLSLDNTIKVLSALPNLQSLEVTLPRIYKVGTDNGEDIDEDEYEGPGPEVFKDNTEAALIHFQLKNIISNLPGLRSLAFNGYEDDNYRTPDSYVIDMIKCLPLLEHLKCDYLHRTLPESSDPTDLFEWHLSQLRNLSSLDLSQCENFDLSWIKQTWPKKITSLKILLCTRIKLSDLHQLIPHFAPHLIRLSLGIHIFDIVFVLDDFVIPTLTHLVLDLAWSRESQSLPLLAYFQDCRGIRSIKQKYPRRSEWGPIADMVCASTWPQLESLDLIDWSDVSEGEVLVARSKLKNFCTDNGIMFVLKSKWNMS